MTHLFKPPCLTLTLLASAITCAFTQAHAQTSPENSGEIETIIVTSSKTVKSIQEVPASMAVVDEEQISQAARVSASDILSNVAGVEVQGAARGQVIAIRGLGSDLPPGVGESSVSTNYDEVYSIRAEAGLLGFYDLDRVEVMRGPQGTLYGRNATAGVVNFISKDPTLDEVKGHVTGSLGNYSFKRAEGAINIPLSDTLAVRVAATGVDRDGYLSNGHADMSGDGQRIKLLYQPNDDLRILAGYDRIHLGGMGSGGVEDSNWDAGLYYTTADPDIGDGQDYTADKYYLKADWKLGAGTLTILPSYQEASGTNEGFFGGRGSSGYDPKNVEQNALEIRYASLPGAPVEWVFGYYHYDYEQYTEACVLNTDGSVADTAEFSNNTGDSDAIFAQATFPLSDDWRLTTGARYTKDSREAQGTAPPPVNLYTGVREDNFFDWKLGIEHNVSEDTLLFAQAATGFRPGGVNPFNGDTIVPEDLLSYEGGIKTRLMDNRLQLNSSLFYYDYEDFQIVDFFITATGPNLVFYNADATNWGGEFELLAAPTEYSTLNLSLAYLNSEITSDLCLNPFGYAGEADAACAALSTTALNFNGERLPHSPEWTLKGGYELLLEGEGGWYVVPRLDIRYVSEQYVAPSNQPAALQEGYLTGDFTVTWHSADDNLSVSAFVKNIADEAIKTAYFVGYSIPGAPREFGITANYRF